MTTSAREDHGRIKRIVRDLRQFTRLDEAERKSVPIADPIQPTANLVRTRYDSIRFDLDLDVAVVDGLRQVGEFGQCSDDRLKRYRGLSRLTAIAV